MIIMSLKCQFDFILHLRYSINFIYFIAILPMFSFINLFFINAKQVIKKVILIIFQN